MGPLDVFYCWQALVIATLASGCAELLKRFTDIVRGLKVDADGDGKIDMWEAIGRELRRDAVVWNKILLPSSVLFFGAMWAVMLPVRPEVLMKYAATHAAGKEILVFAGWGLVCGQFADYAFTKLKSLAGGILQKRNPNAD